MRVLMTNWLYYPEFCGGALQSHRLARRLINLGVNVEVLAGTDKLNLVGYGEVDGVPVIRVLRNKSTWRHKTAYAGEIFRYIYKNQKRYDILHAHGFHAPVSLAAKATGIPLVQKITNQNVDDPVSVRERKFGWFASKVYNWAKVIVPTSPLLEKTCQTGLGSKTRYERLSNGVDTELFSPVPPAEKAHIRNRLKIPHDRIVLLSVGLVSYRKGIDSLIKAVYTLTETLDEDFILWVIGPQQYAKGFGQYDKEVESFVKKIEKMISFYGLEDIVYFKQTQTRVHEYMQAADIYIHPSRQEGQPNAILEAMSTSLPTVANIIPGITDEIIQTGKYGFLVNCEDTERFAAALKIMMRNPGLRERMGKNASLEILNNYNINDIAMKYLALYESLTVKKRIAFSKQPRKLTHRANEIQ